MEKWEVRISDKNELGYLDTIRSFGGDYVTVGTKYKRGLGWFTSSGRKTPDEWKYAIIQLTISGKGEVNHYGQRYEVPVGTGFVACSDDENVNYQAVDSDWQFCYVEVYGQPMSALVKNSPPVFKFDLTHEIIDKIISYQPGEDHASFDIAEQQELIGQLKRMILKSRVQSKPHRSLFIEKAVSKLSNASLKISTVNDLARCLHVSREYLSRQFKGELQTSPYQFILNKRMTKALNLLLYSELSIKEVASACGFSSSTTFGRQFNKKYNMRPSELRQKL